MEAVKDINGVRELRHIDDAERARCVPNANLLHPCPDTLHGFPVVRLQPMLHQVELVSSFAARRFRKSAQVV